MVESTDPAAECGCGRSANRPHCPKCGSYQTYGYANRVSVIRPGGKEDKVKTFRCLLCSEIFNDDDWQFRCNAPERKPAGRKKKPVEPLTEEEHNRLLEQIRGIQAWRDLP